MKIQFLLLTFVAAALAAPANDNQKSEVELRIEALVSAINDGNETAVDLLIKQGADVNANADYDETIDGRLKHNRGTPLVVAAARGHDNIVKLLIENGAEVNRTGKDGMDPLMMAVVNNHESTVKLLIEKGADVNAVMKRDDENPVIHMAACLGHDSILEILIENGADVGKTDYKGENALMLAAECGRKSTVKLLIEMGANVNAKDSVGWTALHKVSGLVGRRLNYEMAKLLIENGADVNAESDAKFYSGGRTPLALAISVGDKKIENLLIQNGARVENKTKDGGITSCNIHGPCSAK